MLSLSSMKDGTIVPNEDDRKKILTQMKVKTTLRSDKSWIQKKSDSEEERIHSPLHSPLRRRKTGERSPASPKACPLNHRALFEELSSQGEQQYPMTRKSSKKALSEEFSSQAEQQSSVANQSPQKESSEELSSQSEQQPSKKSYSTTSVSGYLIRGVFTRTVDKNAPSNIVSNGSQKSAKSASTAPGYRMSTEDYKKLAPYNVKRDTAPDQGDLPVSPDEQQKRTEAASSVLRQTARKERSYVLSAAKKSNGSAAREAPSYMAKRVEIEDDIGPRSRSQTMPASSWINSRGRSLTFEERRNRWNAASSASVDTASRNQASRHSPGYSMAFNHFTSLENSNKQDQEKHNRHSWDESPPRSAFSSPKRSAKKEGNFQPASGSEMQDAMFSEDSWEGRKAPNATMNRNSPVPYASPESSPKRSIFRSQTGGADATVDAHLQSQLRENLNENGADSERYAADQEEGTYGSPSSRITEDMLGTAQSDSRARDSTAPLPGEGHSVPTTTTSNNQHIDLQRPLSSMEQKNAQEAYESSNETEYKKVEAHLAQSDSWSSEGSLSTAGTQTEHLESAKSEEPVQQKARSNSLSGENSVLNPQNHQGEHGSDSDSSRSFSTSRENLVTNSMRSHRMPFYKDICDAESRRGTFNASFSTTSTQFRTPSASGYESDPTTSGKTLLFVKESVNSTELSSSPRYNSRSLIDLSTMERQNYNNGNFMQSSPPIRPSEDICTYCGREIRNCPKIKIEKLNICCHDFCFRCGICHKPMGDLLDKIYIHRDIVHCDKCYEKLF